MQKPSQENPQPADVPIPDDQFSDDNTEDSALSQWKEFHDPLENPR